MLTLEQLHQHQYSNLSTIAPEISWVKVWDTALDHGVSTLCRLLFNRTCPCCSLSVKDNLTYIEHLIAAGHADLLLDPLEGILDSYNYIGSASASSANWSLGERT